LIKRRQILIDRTFQHRLAIDLMIIVLIVPAVLWADFYILGQYALSRNPNMGNVGGWGMIGALLKQQWFFMLLIFALNFAIVYAFIVYYTHRIAGPIYRFCRTFDDMAQGKIEQHIKLRKRDYFENLGESINRFSASLTGSINELRGLASEAAERAKKSKDNELKAKIASIEQVLSRFAPPREPEAAETPVEAR